MADSREARVERLGQTPSNRVRVEQAPIAVAVGQVSCGVEGAPTGSRKYIATTILR